MSAEITYILIGLLLGWISLGLLYLLFRVGQRWWHVRNFGTSIDHGFLAVNYGKRMSNANDHKAISLLLTRDVASELGVNRSVLLLPKRYQLVGFFNQSDLSLPINNAAVRWVSSSGEAQRSTRGRLKELISQSRTDLTWTRVWVPIMRGTQLKGLWLLGDRKDGERYSPEDLHWLTTMAREAAAVLEGLHYTEQERQVANEVRTLYQQVVTTREAERGRLARELHDGVLQDLCAVVRDLKALNTGTDSGNEPYQHLVDISSETVDSLRAICNDLRPPLLEQGLASALKALVEEMDLRSPAPVYIEISAQSGELRLPDDTALAIFRITQEALNNALRYADASEIAVRITKYPDRIRLTVTDDGQGIQEDLESSSFVSSGHFGIAGMRERAMMIGGNLDVQTSLGYGTVVVFEMPS